MLSLSVYMYVMDRLSQSRLSNQFLHVKRAANMNGEEGQSREERLQRRQQREVEQEPEKQQRRGKSDWPGAEKDTGHVEEQVWLTR